MAQHITDPFGSIQPELRVLIYVLLAAHIAAFVSALQPAHDSLLVHAACADATLCSLRQAFWVCTTLRGPKAHEKEA